MKEKKKKTTTFESDISLLITILKPIEFSTGSASIKNYSVCVVLPTKHLKSYVAMLELQLDYKYSCLSWSHRHFINSSVVLHIIIKAGKITTAQMLGRRVPGGAPMGCFNWSNWVIGTTPRTTAMNWSDTTFISSFELYQA